MTDLNQEKESSDNPRNQVETLMKKIGKEHPELFLRKVGEQKSPTETIMQYYQIKQHEREEENKKLEKETRKLEKEQQRLLLFLTFLNILVVLLVGYLAFIKP